MIGQKLQDGRFEVLRQLADGWMGEEYVVFDENRRTNLALRVLDQLDEESFAVLQQEHTKLFKFGHFSLFYFFELFQEEGHWFLITDLVEEFVDFVDWVEGETSLSLERVQYVCWQVADALNFLHKNETFHGRLYGSNVKVLPGDEVRVAEFGLVQKGEGEGQLAEQVCEDWRALGLLLFMGLTGKSLEAGEKNSFTRAEILKQVAVGRGADENLVEELADLCLELLQIQVGVEVDGASMAMRLKPVEDTSDTVAEALLDELKGSRGCLERSELVEKLIQRYTLRGQFEDAFDLACEEAEALGVQLPRRVRRWRFGWVALLTRLRLKRGKIGEALQLPNIEDAKLKAVLRIMHSAWRPAMQIEHKLGWFILMEGVLLSLRKGMSPESLALFAIYGLIYRGGGKGEYAFGEEMGQKVLSLARCHSDCGRVGEVEYLVGMHGTCWLHPAEEGECLLLKAYESGKDSGALRTAGLAALGMVASQWMRGVRLQELWELTERFLPFIEESELEELPAVLRMVRQMIKCYRGEASDVHFLNGDDCNERQLLGALVGFQNRHLAQFSYVLLANFCAANGRLVASKIHAHMSHENIQEGSSWGMLLHAEHFYQEILSNGCDQEFGNVKKFLPKALNQFQNWASLCPYNFKAKKEMIFAEDYLNAGRSSDALDFYLQAAESARQDENFLVHAWAFERATSLPEGEKFMDARSQAWKEYGALTLVNQKCETI